MLTAPLESRPVRHCRLYSLGAAGAAVFVGGLVLLGWTLEIPELISVLPGLASMKPNTAICFALAGVSLYGLRLLPGEQCSPREKELWASRVLGGAIALAGAVVLAEYFLHRNFGIDDFLFHRALAAGGSARPGIMSAATAMGFFLLGSSLLSVQSSARWRILSQFCALLAAIDGLIAIAGYLYGFDKLYRVPPYSSMALHTASLFFLLGMASLAARPQLGLMAAATTDRIGGVMARRAMPLAVVLPLFVGWVRWRAQLAGYFGTEFGLALFALSNVVTFAILLWVNASWLNRVDEERSHAEERDLRMAAIMNSTTDAVIGKDRHGLITSWNRGAERQYGFSEREALGQPVSLILHAPSLQKSAEVMREVIQGHEVAPYETVHRRKDGTSIEVSVTTFPVLDKSGFITGISSMARNITERKRMEAALRKSEGQYGAVLQSAMDAVISIDARQRIVMFNASAEKMFACSAEQALHQPIDRFIPERFRAAHAGHIHHFGHTGSSNRAMGAPDTLWALRASGEEFPIEASISQIGSGDDKLFTVIIRDVTERKLAAEALRDQAEVLDLAQVLVCDMEGRIVLWTTGAQRLYGFSREEALGRISHQLFRTQFPDSLEQIQEHLLLHGAWEGELVHRKQDGQRIVVSSLWVLQRDAESNPSRILEANTDVTARRLAQQQLASQAQELSCQAGDLVRSRVALEEQTRTLQSVLDNIEDGLILADAQGRFVLWNPAADKILGQGKKDLPPEQWAQHYCIFQPDTVTPFFSADLPLAHAILGREAHAEMFVRHQGAESGIWIEASARPVRDASGALTGGVVAFRDITPHKLAEREIRALNADLERRVLDRTAQLEAVNQELESFSYSVSHDLRAPLRHISGFAGILLEDHAPQLVPEAQVHLRQIVEGAKKMASLIDELLNLAKLGRHPIGRQPVNLRAVVEEVIALLHPETENREIKWKMSDFATVDCDPTLTKQIFQNLISNALKYSRLQPHAVIEIGEATRDGESAIFVRDNGIGFDMKYAGRLFGVFQRLHSNSAFEGLGIGLTTAARIVQKHGGRIWAESIPGQGATFYFTLAATPRKATSAAAGEV